MCDGPAFEEEVGYPAEPEVVGVCWEDSADDVVPGALAVRPDSFALLRVLDAPRDLVNVGRLERDVKGGCVLAVLQPFSDVEEQLVPFCRELFFRGFEGFGLPHRRVVEQRDEADVLPFREVAPGHGFRELLVGQGVRELSRRPVPGHRRSAFPFFHLPVIVIRGKLKFCASIQACFGTKTDNINV